MKKILENETLVNSSAALSAEAVKAILNDATMKEFNECCAKLLAEAKESNAKTNKDLLKSPVVSKALNDMTNMITKRFGIGVVFKLTDEIDIYSMPVIPMTNSAIDIYRTNTLNYFAGVVAMYMPGGAKPSGKPTQLVTQENFEDELLRLLESSKKLQEATKLTGITVDRDKIKLLNVPKEVYGTVVFNLLFCVEVGLSETELAAVLTHEIGHIWTSIEYLSRRTITLTAATDALQDSIRDKRSPREAICYTAEKTGNAKLASELKDKNIITCVTMLGHIIAGDDLYATKDSEHVADQFAARLGYSGDVITAIAKLEGVGLSTEAKDSNSISVRNFSNYPWYLKAMLVIGIISLLVYIKFIILTLAVTAGMVALAILILLPVIAIPILIIAIAAKLGQKYERKVGKGFTAQEYEDTDEHDDIYDRSIRMKQEIIRILRTSNIPKSELAPLLDQLSTIDMVLSMVPKKEVSAFDGIKRFFSRTYRNNADIEALDKQIESLMENNLHALSAKFEILKGK